MAVVLIDVWLLHRKDYKPRPRNRMPTLIADLPNADRYLPSTLVSSNLDLIDPYHHPSYQWYVGHYRGNGMCVTC